MNLNIICYRNSKYDRNIDIIQLEDINNVLIKL